MPDFPRIDHYPQSVGVVLTQTGVAGANTDTEIRVELPRYLFGTGATRTYAIVWELLKAEVLPTTGRKEDRKSVV